MAISTPEGVPVDITLAGLGSRIGAAVLDGIIQGVIIIALFVILALGGDIGDSTPDEDWLIIFAVSQVIAFGVLFFYYVIFETLWSGRSLGKRAFGIRVIDSDGGPVGVRASMVRNLLRLIDALPIAYLVGTVVILASERNQRLGDIVGGTLVIRDVGRVASVRFDSDVRPRGWDVTGVTDEDLAVVHGLMARWSDISPAARERLADDIKGRLAGKIGGEDQSLPAYEFLQQVIAETSSRERR